MVFGCILWPIIVSLTADPGALDLLGSAEHDEGIVAAAWAAIAQPAAVKDLTGLGRFACEVSPRVPA